MSRCLTVHVELSHKDPEKTKGTDRLACVTVRGACSPLGAAFCADTEGDTSQSSGVLKVASGPGT